MIIPFFIVILASITNCDESSENKYINKLPDVDRKVFLDNVARRILEEVPDVKSVETSAANGGDVLEEKLKAQSEFVQKILKQEVDSLKAKRRNNITIKKENNATNETDFKLVTQISTLLNQSVPEILNNTRKADADSADTTTVTEHIDLTFRAHDNEKSEKIDSRRKKSTADKRRSENYEQFVPVNVKYDEEVLNEQKQSNKSFNRKREIVSDSEEKRGGVSAELPKNKTWTRSDDTGYLSKTRIVNTTTNDAKVISNEILDIVEETTKTTKKIEKVTETVTESTNITEPVTETLTQIKITKPAALQNNQSNESESSEFLGEHLIVENKTEKTVETTPSNHNKTTTSIEPELNTTYGPTSKDLIVESTSITPLTTTEASPTTTGKVETKPEKVKIMRIGNNADNKTTNSIIINNDPVTTTEALIALTTTPKTCDKCNQSNQENKTEESRIDITTTDTVITSKRFDTSVTNTPGDLSDSSTTGVIEKLKTSLRGSKRGHSKHSPQHMHYGDAQVPQPYEVFEVDPDKPAFIPQKQQPKLKLSADHVEKVPVHIYDKEHAYYNGHSKFLPDPGNVDSTFSISSISETVEETYEKTKVGAFKNWDEKKKIQVVHDYDALQPTHRPYRLRPRLSVLPITQEEEHLFQIHNKGLKDSLKAVRGSVYTNMFGYVPTNHERGVELNATCIYAPNTYKNFFKKLYGIVVRGCHGKEDDDVLNSAKEDMRDEETIHQKDAYYSVMDFLKRSLKRLNKSTKGQGSLQNLSYDIYGNTITLNGVTYDLADDDKLGSLLTARDSSTGDTDDNERIISWLKSLKYRRKKETVNISGEKSKLSEALRALQMADKLKSSSEETIELGKKTRTAIIQQKMPASLERKQKRYSITNRNRKERLGERDPSQNKEQVLEMTKTVETNDKELELHLNILKDLVKMDNTGLKRFDWLGTTVDIQAALRKLMDLTEKRIHHRHLHPSDLNLLQYVQELYEKAGDTLFQREEEKRLNRDEESRILNDNRHARSFPKNGKTISKPLKILDHIWEMMNEKQFTHVDIIRKINKRLGSVPLSIDEEFLIFLYTIQIRLQDFHEAIKQIASITKYNDQKWYINIKDLYLSRAGRKEYMEVLLHFFLTRLFDLIEENMMAGANRDFKQFMKDMRVEVDRTEVELVFILKILKEIKSFK